VSPALRALFVEYAADHQHPTNRLLHKFGVPLITFHILAMLDWVRLLPLGDTGLHLSLAWPFAAAVLAWYLRLDARLALGMAVFGVACLLLAPFTPAWLVVAIAVVAWAGQLVGHGVYEKRSPSLTRNFLQILVGPLFVLALLSGRLRGQALDAPAPAV